MFFKRQIKISDDFGFEFISKLFTTLNKEGVFLEKEEEITPEMIYYHFFIEGKRVSFFSEGQIGTFIIGNKKRIDKVISILKESNDIR